jgi:L-aspartate oxidase
MPLPSSFDVLVIGAGAAGLYTALCLPSHFQVGLVTKDTLNLSASDWAQGGIAAVVAPDDSTDLHVQDTLQAGAGLCDLAAVKFLVENAAYCIADLVNMGVGFDRHDGSLALTLEAAHSRRRVLHAADTTGRAVVSALAEQVLHRANIHVISQALTLDLWLDAAAQCQGVSVSYQGQVVWLRAGAVILATGGGGQVFAQTTNPSLSTGDGVAIAHRAGAILRDLEFVQFHPTALTQAGAPRFLISEAVRGEGAHLVDAAGRRFAFDYHPDGELAPRDIVSRSIFRYLQSTHADPTTGHVYLDLRAIAPDRIRYRFPNIIQICQQWGIDVFTQPIPVAPAAHYWMGGIATDLQNQTSIPGLYAVGEAASTGVHGANRLASNSLLECIVFGSQFAHLARKPLDPTDPPPGPTVPSNALSMRMISTPASADLMEIQQMRHALPRLLWQSAGICREGTVMAAAIAQVHRWQTHFQTLSISQILENLSPGENLKLDLSTADLRLWAETRNLLAIADLILQSAQYRTESRGGHYRTDYPQTDPAWAAHTIIQRHQWSIEKIIPA